MRGILVAKHPHLQGYLLHPIGHRVHPGCLCKIRKTLFIIKSHKQWLQQNRSCINVQLISNTLNTTNMSYWVVSLNHTFFMHLNLYMPNHWISQSFFSLTSWDRDNKISTHVPGTEEHREWKATPKGRNSCRSRLLQSHFYSK